jgi:hypothetical protein
MKTYSESKTESLKKALASGDVPGALSLGRNFKIGFSPEQIDQIRRGYECTVRPDFYKQLKYNPENEITQAFSILYQHYFEEK